MEINQQHIVPYTSSSNQQEADYADNLYPGYKFLPSDSELIVHYLKPKIATGTHPPCRLHEVYLYDHHPKQLSETYRASENKWYFLTSRERRYPKGRRPKRSTKEFGTWKAAQNHIVYDRQMVVGYRTDLAFFDEKGHKTEWLMHEYRTDDPNLPFGSGQNGNELNRYVLCKVYKKQTGKKRARCKVYKKQTGKKRARNQAKEIQNVRDQEVERGSPSAYSLPVNHGSILDQGTMNNTLHPILQPGSSSIQPASEDPNYEGFRREVQASFVAAPPLPPDGYVNNYTTVPLSPSPVSISRNDRQSQFQNTSHHLILQPGVTSYGSSSIQPASEDPNYQGFKGEVQASFVAAPPLPDGYINNYTTVVLSPSPVSISTDARQAEFQNQSGSNDRQSVLVMTQDAPNDDIPQPCRPCDYNATNRQSVVLTTTDHVPQPCDYNAGGLMSPDRLEHFTEDDLEWTHEIISEIAMMQLLHSLC